MDTEQLDDPRRRGITPYLEAPEFPPPSATVHGAFGAASRVGRLHAINEDHYAVIRLGRHQETLMTSLPEALIGKRFDEEGFAMIVADGLGNEGGETASRIALVTLLQLVLHFGKWNLRVDDRIAQEIMERAERFYRHVDSAVVHEGMTRGPRHAQTTLTAVFGAGRDLFFAHVGHSRAYLLRDGALMRLTRDHTIGRPGSITPPVAPLVDINTTARDLKHVLSETIGMSGSIGPMIDLERFQAYSHDHLLVCTNGVTDALDERAIADVLASPQSPHDQCRTLVDLAAQADGADDATALIAAFGVV